MNVWLAIGLVLFAVLVVLAAGIPLIFWIIRSVVTAGRELADNGWQRDDVIRLLKKVALYGVGVLFVSLLPWTLLLTTFGAMADQYFRNTVNQHMSGPDLFQHLAIKEDEYHAQSLHWRQALAEITLRQGDEDEALKQFVSQIDTRQIVLLEAVAKYSLGGALLEPGSFEGDPRRELSYMSLMHLEEIGIIDSAVPFNHKRITSAADGPSDDDVTDSLWLKGHQYAIHLRADVEGTGTQLSFFALTETGKSLINALRRPTSLSYLCWLQSRLSEMRLSAEVWAIETDESNQAAYRRSGEIPESCGSVDRTTPGVQG